MTTFFLRPCAWVWVALFFGCHVGLADGFDYESLTLVDTVECATDAAHDFLEFPAAASSVETVLGQSVRALPSGLDTMSYFAYRLGKGKGLQADKGYILRVIYPEDQPRSIFVLNRGCETSRGFHTGNTTGDGLVVPYVNNNCESLELPLSGQFEEWEMLFYLQERFPGIKQPRGTDQPRDQTPDDGFLVFCLQLSCTNDPLSAGVAIDRIELYEAPPLEELTQPLATLPPGLPKRHLFWREEMADGLIDSTNPTERGFAEDRTWYEQKFRLMQFLGMQTFAKDLLEFGANQGWDSSKYGGNDWVYQSKHTSRWSQIVKRCGELGFDLLPYYEYAGSKGTHGLGFERRAEPRYGRGHYTHISWSEVANVDVTDPDTFEDFRKMLEITVTDEQENGNFAGIWMRTRISDIPVSFADATRARFEAETGRTDVTRVQLKDDAALYDEYIDWWQAKRRIFLEQVRDYLRTNVHADMALLYTADATEPGCARLKPNQSKLIAEDPAPWAGTGHSVLSLADAVTGNWELHSLTNPVSTWGYYEWQHAVPYADPDSYKETAGIFMTETVNHAYTIEPDVMDAFHAKDGLAAIRHYSLNEDATQVGTNKYMIGYFVADVDYAGPFVMLPEALSFAHGDPTYFGYLASNNFNRGNPFAVRRFNANFMALPALPSVIDTRMSSDPALVVRRIDTPANGIYLGAVHIGRTQANFLLTLPEPGRLLDAVTGEVMSETGSPLTLRLDPYELRAFRFFPTASNTAPEVAINDHQNLEWLNAIGTHHGWVFTELCPSIIDYDGDALGGATWSILSGDSNQVRIQHSDRLKTHVAFSGPGTYVLNLAVSDGKSTRNQEVTITVATRRAQIILNPAMADYSSTNIKDSGLFNNQLEVGDPPYLDVGETWDPTWNTTFPIDIVVDLGQPYDLEELWLYDLNNSGGFRVFSGSAGSWTNIVDIQTDAYKSWKRFDLDLRTRFLKVERVDGGGIVGELILYGRGGGLDYANRLIQTPIQPELLLNQSGKQVKLNFHLNPLAHATLRYSENLKTWETLGEWDGEQPFVEYVKPAAKSGFFKITESP